MQTNQFAELEANLEAMLHESMVKIGYMKGKPVGVYYTEDLLCHLLGIPTGDRQEASSLLTQFADDSEELWGRISFEYANRRYKLTVPAKGLDYVYQRNKDKHFLEELINTLKKPDITIDDVTKVFKKYSDNVISEKSNNDEFEYAVHFADKRIDAFIYCFSFDEMGQYYHRFTEYDYVNLK